MAGAEPAKVCGLGAGRGLGGRAGDCGRAGRESPGATLAPARGGDLISRGLHAGIGAGLTPGRIFSIVVRPFGDITRRGQR